VLLSSHRIGVRHGISALSAYRGQRFVQGLEDVIGADEVAQAGRSRSARSDDSG
jgi:hypothetical protein